MNVLLLSPGFPAEMPLFARGLAQVGARVFGVGDQPSAALDPETRRALDAYLQVRDLWDEAAVAREVGQWLGQRKLDRVECLWEPGMLLAARLREVLEVPGLTVEQTSPFRDKEHMKAVLDRHGVRTPSHARCRTQDECRAAAARFGYPLIIKPIAGAGSADTYPLRSSEDLEQALALLGHVDEVSVEEFVEGEEYTFDTVCSEGQILFENVAWYRPKPLVARLNAWISPQAVCLKDLAAPELAAGRELGRRVLAALGFKTGFAHMEWFRRPDGEAVFGEIGARPPGARLVHVMNYSCDVDLFAGWAEALCWGRLSQETSKKFNAAVIFKRAEGAGPTVTSIAGLQGLLAKHGEHVAAIDLVKVGEPRRDWRKVLVGDGWIVVRHPSLESTLEIADYCSTHVRVHADL